MLYCVLKAALLERPLKASTSVYLETLNKGPNSNILWKTRVSRFLIIPTMMKHKSIPDGEKRASTLSVYEK